jgi:hypothetical protein
LAEVKAVVGDGEGCPATGRLTSLLVLASGWLENWRSDQSYNKNMDSVFLNPVTWPGAQFKQKADFYLLTTMMRIEIRRSDSTIFLGLGTIHQIAREKIVIKFHVFLCKVQLVCIVLLSHHLPCFMYALM